ncbi:MAG: hypothetical protein CVU33_10080 [Betaproteobacteria bacterium HGW-Betaproteobacteria-6]|nr:MAG: hypothetical protein CVU33_10080 [Betaproteobacteria bacterium HGW-Betaproteobacteria-6]
MSNLMTLNNDSRPWYKERWPWFLMAGPGVVIVAGFVTLWLAVVSNDGLVSDDYYKQGLAVNQSLQRDHQAGSLGLQGDVMRSGSSLRLLLRADSDAGLPSEIVLKLAHHVSGRWLVSIEDPAAKWRLQGEWQADSLEPLRLMARSGK